MRAVPMMFRRSLRDLCVRISELQSPTKNKQSGWRLALPDARCCRFSYIWETRRDRPNQIKATRGGEFTGGRRRFGCMSTCAALTRINTRPACVAPFTAPPQYRLPRWRYYSKLHAVLHVVGWVEGGMQFTNDIAPADLTWFSRQEIKCAFPIVAGCGVHTWETEVSGREKLWLCTPWRRWKTGIRDTTVHVHCCWR